MVLEEKKKDSKFVNIYYINRNSILLNKYIKKRKKKKKWFEEYKINNQIKTIINSQTRRDLTEKAKSSVLMC